MYTIRITCRYVLKILRVGHCFEFILTNLAAAVPQVLRVGVAGVDAHAVGVDLGEEALVVRDEVGGAGGGQSQRQRLAERAHLAVALCDKPAKSYCLMPQ